MPNIVLDGYEYTTHGSLPNVGDTAPDFSLCDIDLNSVEKEDLAGLPVIINVFPSIDTSQCFNSVKTLNDSLVKMKTGRIICVSMDLPFTLKRVGLSESFINVLLLSDFRNRDFGEQYGLTIADGPLAGLLARAIFVLDGEQKIIYRELVEDISNPPNYAAAFEAINAIKK